MPVLEESIASLEEQLNTVTDYSEISKISKELDDKRNELETLETRWLELSEKES